MAAIISTRSCCRRAASIYLATLSRSDSPIYERISPFPCHLCIKPLSAILRLKCESGEALSFSFCERKQNIKVTLGCLMIKFAPLQPPARFRVCVWHCSLLPRPLPCRPRGAGFCVFARSAKKTGMNNKENKERKTKRELLKGKNALITLFQHKKQKSNRTDMPGVAWYYFYCALPKDTLRTSRPRSIRAGLPLDYAHSMDNFWAVPETISEILAS